MNTHSTPFIYIKSSASNKAQKKKILLPKSLTALIKVAQKNFKEIANIKSIMNKEKKFVRTIEEVKPGETYVISDMDPNLIPEPPMSESAKISSVMTSPPSPGRSATPTLITVQNRDPMGSPGRRSGSNLNSPNSSKLSPAPPSLRRPLVAGAGFQMLGAQSSLIIDSDDEDFDTDEDSPNSKYKKGKKSLFGTPKDGSKSGRSGGKRYKKRIGENGEIEYYTDEDYEYEKQKEQEEADLKEVIDQLDLGISEKLMESLPSLKSYAPFVRKSSNIEKMQLMNYSKSESKNFKFSKDMQQYIRKAFISQTHFAQGNSSFIPRIIITGSKASGKSTLLNIARDEVYIHIASCQLQKKILVLNLDGIEIRSVSSDLNKLYEYFIDRTFDGLVKSYPNISAFTNTLKRHFLTCLTSQTAPHLSQTIIDNFGRTTEKLNELGREVNDAVQTGTSSVIISNAIAFPNMLANIFQMKTLFIIDNLDLTDIPITDNEFCMISDLLHFILNISCFIVAPKDESSFYSIFDTPDGINIISKSIRLPTTDIVQSTQYNQKLLVTFDCAPQKPIPLTFDVCGGCPAYCKLWEDIHEVCDKTARMEDNEEKEAEVTTVALPFVYQVLDTQDLKVLSVKRSN